MLIANLSLNQVSYFFFLFRSLFSSLCTVFYSVSSDMDEVLSINPSANVFVLETLTSIIRTGLPILIELINLVNSIIILLSQMTLLRWLTFLHGSQTVILIVLLFWTYFFLLTLVFVLQWLPSIGKFWSCCCLSFHWLSIKFTMGCLVSSHSLWLFSCWLGSSLWSFERCSIGGYL